ncbi:MAG: CDP-glucose 4,6-dehydratase [Ferruginibacter sp.]|nr:CDP-glucose 4,6-dehydratase [Ferruginibacter sp.]
MVTQTSITHFYKGRRVFITGHTGFKGSWLIYVLHKAGAVIKGYSLFPETNPSLYSQIEESIHIESVIADINDARRLETEILSFQPDHIFHMAAQPLVRRSYNEPLNTFSTNVIGTANVLSALTKLEKPCTAVFITTDKVYENKEWHYPYRETDRLGGYDPYSASKACAELVINSYHQSFFNLSRFEVHQKAIASVRAGNVIGGGDWSEDRLLPDIVKALAQNRDIIIRNPGAIRPWQHVLEPVFGYLRISQLLAANPMKYNGAWNFGPANDDNLSVIEVAQQAISIWGKGNIDLREDRNALHEAGLLKLDTSKAVNELGWKPRMRTGEAIARTIQWYKCFYEKTASPAELLIADILYYQSILIQ